MCVHLVNVYQLLNNDNKMELNIINIKEANYTKVF